LICCGFLGFIAFGNWICLGLEKNIIAETPPLLLQGEGLGERLVNRSKSPFAPFEKAISHN